MEEARQPFSPFTDHISSIGKTPPLLLEHLSHYNPRRLPSSSYNILTQLELFTDIPWPKEKVASSACRHIWTLQPDQTSTVGDDDRAGTTSTANAACINCRCHVELVIDFRDQTAGGKCPNEDAPLHHFIYTPDDDCGLVIKPKEVTGPTIWRDTQKFRCSSSSCSTQLLVRLRSPRLTSNWVALLSDKRLIRRRAELAMSADQTRYEGHAIPSVSEVITTLRTYINNAMTAPEPRRIKVTNKKWLLVLGESCTELLEYIGFSRSVWTISNVYCFGIAYTFSRRPNGRRLGRISRTQLLTPPPSVYYWTMLIPSY